jgi:hypothetical protein
MPYCGPPGGLWASHMAGEATVPKGPILDYYEAHNQGYLSCIPIIYRLHGLPVPKSLVQEVSTWVPYTWPQDELKYYKCKMD